MYANLITFTLGPGKRPVAEKLVAQFAPALKARDGFKSQTFLGDDVPGEYSALVVFESREQAQATFEAMFPQLKQALTGIVQGEPSRGLLEVIEPKA